jgi:tetratricopeptide (TPR) repeat protein
VYGRAVIVGEVFRETRWWARAVLSAAAVLLILAAPGRDGARAEDVEALVKKGVELRRQGRDRDALAEFQRALAIERQPRIVSQIGLAEQALGDWVSAATHLETALATADDAWIKKNRAILEQALQAVENHLGRVDVWGEPAGAEVLLDGAPVGTLPLAHPVRVTESQITLTVRAQGYTEIVRVLRIPLGDLVREHVALRPLAATEGKPRLPVAAAPAEAGAATGAATQAPLKVTVAQKAAPTEQKDQQPSSSSSPSVFHRWWFWTLVGAVAVGAGTGAYLLSRNPCDPPGCSNWPN